MKRKSAPKKRAPAATPRPTPRRTVSATSPLSGPSAEALPKSADVDIWEDDPESEGAALRSLPAPGDPQSRFPINIISAAPAPGKYPPGTPEFRYWMARSALVKCRDFWEPLLPPDAAWQTGAQLPVTVDGGIQLNAYYHRAFGLTFYGDRQGERFVHTAESADVVCHEMGHAVLDALQPSLWLALTTETAAFHEAFGDISALLAGLHEDSLCAHVLGRHGGWIERDSRWTRIGEALGRALNERDPGRASPLWLRNAANAFYYQSPAQLPVSGPDSQLTREPHSLARTFIGASLQALAGIVRADSSAPSVAAVQQSAWKFGAWLVAAIRHAPVQRDYFFQVASALTAQAAKGGGEPYRDLVASAFVRRGILPVDALDGAWPSPPPALAPSPSPADPGLAMAGASATPFPHRPLTLDGRRLGLKIASINIRTSRRRESIPTRARAFDQGLHRSVAPFASVAGLGIASSAAPDAGLLAEPAPPEDGFVKYLFQRGRVEFTPDTVGLAAYGPVYARKTHRLVIENNEPTLERVGFDCGFD